MKNILNLVVMTLALSASVSAMKLPQKLPEVFNFICVKPLFLEGHLERFEVQPVNIGVNVCCMYNEIKWRFVFCRKACVGLEWSIGSDMIKFDPSQDPTVFELEAALAMSDEAIALCMKKVEQKLMDYALAIPLALVDADEILFCEWAKDVIHYISNRPPYSSLERYTIPDKMAACIVCNTVQKICKHCDDVFSTLHTQVSALYL